MEIRTTDIGGLDMTCLPAETVVAEVRHRVEIRLATWGLFRLAYDAKLIAAELVTNALRETPEHEIRIRFTREPKAVSLGVWDSSDQMPKVRPVVELLLEDLDLTPENFDANGGHGLAMVQTLSSECGVQRTPPHGKWVWARLATK